MGLEIQVQRHLDLPWGADGVLNDAEAGGAAIEVIGSAGGTATGGQDGRSLGRECVVEGVLRYLVAGNVEACGVGDVVDVEGVLEVEPVVDGNHLDHRGVSALLCGLPEDVALSGGESGFIGIGGGYGSAESAGWKDGKCEAGGIQSGWRTGRCPCARVTGKRGLGRATRSQRDDGVGNSVVGGVEDAAHRTGEVNDAVGLTALQHGQTYQGPTVGNLASQ